jgi:hypothetical protein
MQEEDQSVLEMACRKQNHSASCSTAVSHEESHRHDPQSQGGVNWQQCSHARYLITVSITRLALHLLVLVIEGL